MKKLFTLLLCIICATMMYAQDIIITKDSKRIEAKIIEVTTTTVKYKKWSYQDGPDIYEAKSNIAAIMWGNGEVESFNTEETTQKVESTIVEEPTITKNTTTEKKIESLPYLTKIGNTYATSDGKSYSGKEIGYYFERNCSGAYDIWVTGEVTRAAGWTLLGCGLALDLISICTSGSISYACGITGGLAELACIPTLIVGYQKKRKAVDYYNGFCTKRNTDLSLNFGVAPKQIGFVLTF